MEIVARKSADSQPAESREPAVRRPVDAPEVAPRKGRSRITNGNVLIPGVDGRSPWIRRCKDIIASHLSDLGGVDNCSAAERSIVRRASVMTVELERLETKFAKAGEASPDDLEVYQRCANSLRRLLEAICSGILQYRRPRDVTPSADEYIAGLPAEEPASADVEVQS
jgi:hypothetical protein